MPRVGTISSVQSYILRNIKQSGTTSYLCYKRDTGWQIDKYVENGDELAITTATDHNNNYQDYDSAVANYSSLTYV